jgi:hypothetical protein
MNTLNPWDTYFRNKLEETLRQYIEVEEARFRREFLLKHGEQLIASAERVLGPPLTARALQRSREGDRDNKRMTEGNGSNNNPGDAIDRVAVELERADHLVRQLHEFKTRIRADYPDSADSIIAEFEDLVDAKLGENGGEQR